ncbi:hypothetical protein C8J56DRAFT_884284 [Mycena floridula]|nr:hypothetical protein C8J56DRAFT_884284 [Mycena floridula]
MTTGVTATRPPEATLELEALLAQPTIIRVHPPPPPPPPSGFPPAHLFVSDGGGGGGVTVSPHAIHRVGAIIGMPIINKTREHQDDRGRDEGGELGKAVHVIMRQQVQDDNQDPQSGGWGKKDWTIVIYMTSMRNIIVLPQALALRDDNPVEMHIYELRLSSNEQIPARLPAEFAFGHRRHTLPVSVSVSVPDSSLFHLPLPLPRASLSPLPLAYSSTIVAAVVLWDVRQFLASSGLASAFNILKVPPNVRQEFDLERMSGPRERMVDSNWE